jgi:elongation factor Tu
MFRMTVEDVFFIKGRGTVATGKVEAGSVRVGDQLTVDDGRTLTVDGIEAFRKILDEAHEGDNIGLLFKKLERDDLARGRVLTGGGGGGGATAASIGLEG